MRTKANDQLVCTTSAQLMKLAWRLATMPEGAHRSRRRSCLKCSHLRAVLSVCYPVNGRTLGWSYPERCPRGGLSQFNQLDDLRRSGTTNRPISSFCFLALECPTVGGHAARKSREYCAPNRIRFARFARVLTSA